mmetsp:Transcript_36209/g.80565  ORF Transcript_36209/g.80565 Transcript_36209/m.80565 type:complete len:134 (+) Transcript_36209:138-539(+)|eukprot:CAMPEP_0202904144 /NCGR_PEP_ID=MMETSP1392-20130828/28114_1 /ASSEMBLY_ACC=CAM_ASM_000868 /TAXON_ID=225041 /ORGANISM="Chlamydomonas chlamydogama, Strain SAG 11-48b" /LENGTH=133 /DNA_ID=CAMNT_0049591647 /DNA_START=134 /DNA_END=535 /DNA_ORIENTATION=-
MFTNRAKLAVATAGAIAAVAATPYVLSAARKTAEPGSTVSTAWQSSMNAAAHSLAAVRDMASAQQARLAPFGSAVLTSAHGMLHNMAATASGVGSWIVSHTPLRGTSSLRSEAVSVALKVQDSGLVSLAIQAL